MDTLKPLIDQLMKLIQNGTDLVNGQLPELAKQILAYNAWNCNFWMHVAIFAVIFCVVVAIFCAIQDCAGAAVVMLVVAIIFAVDYGFNYTELKKIELAPKIYLITELTSLVKKGN
jgi:hypothetical protein